VADVAAANLEVLAAVAELDADVAEVAALEE
jgi:hypothetical protein